jgi:hypothetical protein
VFQPHDQIAGMVPVTRTLQPLTLGEVREVLDRRYEMYAVPGAAAVPPVHDDAVQTLHATYRGKLRRFLALLEGAVIQGPVRGRSLTLADVIAHVQGAYLATLRDRIGDEATMALSKLRPTDGGNPLEVTPAGLAGAGVVNSASRATEFIKLLEGAGVVTFERRKGTSRVYRLSGDAAVALGR